jgi:hypothetical protein
VCLARFPVHATQVVCGSSLVMFQPLQDSARVVNFVECTLAFDDQYAPFEVGR